MDSYLSLISTEWTKETFKILNSPSTGRFLSQDSYSGNPYDPWTQHLYSYCGNNPVNMVDPTGFAAGRFAGFGNDIYTGGYVFTNLDGRGNDFTTTKRYSQNTQVVASPKKWNCSQERDAAAMVARWGGSRSRHDAVWDAVAAAVNGHVEVKVKGGAASGRPDTYGYIDVATFADAKNCVVSGAIIYEIKPYSQLKTLAGEIQLNRYQTAARNQGITIHIAKHDPGVGTVLAPDGTVLYTQFLNGVIYYDDEPIPEDALQRAQQKQSQTSVDVT